MKPIAIIPLALLAAAVTSGAAAAATYHYTDHWDYIGRPALDDTEFDIRLQADAASCDDTAGAQQACRQRPIVPACAGMVGNSCP
jgi:hypothetical protein